MTFNSRSVSFYDQFISILLYRLLFFFFSRNYAKDILLLAYQKNIIIFDHLIDQSWHTLPM